MNNVLLSAVGFTGTVLVLVGYVLISTGRLRAKGAVYQLFNAVGAGLLTLYFLKLAAYAGVLLNAIWFAVAIAALVRLRLNSNT